jgi:hypothetical protein
MEFHKKDSFNSYNFEPEGDQLNGRLLATFDATGVAGGNFRVICAASRPTSFCFPGSKLFVQPQLASFEFIIEIEPESLRFPHNLLSTAWEDLVTAVAEKRVRVFNPAEPQSDDRQFRVLVHSLKDEAHACFRWNVCTHEDFTFSLDLQGLPMSAASAQSKQALSLDTAPTVRLASQEIVFPKLPGDLHIPGPALVVFSDDPDRSSSLLGLRSPLLRHEIARLSWHFTSREYINLQTAKLLSSSPREGCFSRPLCAAIDQHPKPSTSQEFLSTPTPSDPATGKKKGSASVLSCRKYPESFPSPFRSAICLALAQQLSCSPDSPLISQAEKQLAQSITSSTWRRHISAWNSFQSFLESNNVILSWPLSLPLLRQYTVWAHSSRQLHPHTIEAYLSSLNQINQLLGFPNLHVRSDFLVQSLLKGSSHSRFYRPTCTSTRRTITFSILKLLGHQLVSSSWSTNSQLTVWTAALVAF